MTTSFHTPITTGAAANAAVLNAPPGTLDAELVSINTDIGTMANLTTTAKNALVLAINELDAEIGSAALTTTSQTLSGAINEHEVGLAGVKADIGNVAALTTTATTVVTAINELDVDATAAKVTTAEVVAARGAYSVLNDRLNAIASAGGTASTLTNGVANAGQKDITVDSTTGFLAGAPIAYTLVGGVIETNTVSTVTPTVITCTGNVGTGGIANDTFVMVVPLAYIGVDTTNISDLVLLEGGDGYRGAVTFDTTGGLVAAPWIIHTMSAGTSNHDNVLLTTYNVKHKKSTGTWSRVVDNEHGIRFGMESRWTTGDPAAVRGMFEWNLQIERALTGALTFDRAPFYLNYDFDTSAMLMSLGDDADDGNTLEIHAATSIDKVHLIDGYALRVQNGETWFEDDVRVYKTINFMISSVLSGGDIQALAIESKFTPTNLGSAFCIDIGNNVIGSAALRVQTVNGVRVQGATWTKDTSDDILTATGVHISVPTIGTYNAGLTIGTAQNGVGDFAIYSTSAHPSSLAGSLGLGVVAPAASLHVDQSSAIGAKPVLTVDQADVSEEFIRFIGTSAADNTQSLVDAADLEDVGAIVGWLRIYVQDDAVSGAITDGVYFVPFYATPTHSP